MSAGTPTNNLSVCLIGGDTLLSQCGEMLLAAGHVIQKVITDSPAIQSWAQGHEIQAVPADDAYVSELQSCDFDYLLAITHLALIPDAALESATRGAINFHDGPLPAYAGLNTPMWAIINGERNYGITWHMVAPGIDTGDVLLREPVTIAEDDTAVSLNTKCFTAALDSFPRLLEQLASDAVTPESQDLTERTYYGRKDRPRNLGLLDWRESAKDLDRIVRALNTGRYENALGAAKVVIDNQVYIVESAIVRADMTSPTPGEVLSVGNSQFEVACGEGVLEVTRLESIRGSLVDIGSLGMQPGDNLLNARLCDSANDEVSANVAKDETFWTKRLSRAQSTTLPYRHVAAKVTGDQVEERDLALPEGMRSASPEYVAGAFAAFVARITGSEKVSLAVAGHDLSGSANAFPPLLATYGFSTFELDQSSSIASQVASATRDITDTLARAPWLNDLIARQPSVRANHLFATDAPLPLAVVIGDGYGPGAELTLRLKAPGTAVLAFVPSAYSNEAIDRLCGHFASWLGAISQSPDSRACDLDLLTAEERQRLLVELNQTQVDYAQDSLMQTQFEELALATPDAIAVVASGRSITYGELNNRANQLAADLRDAGASADTLIGVYVSRSIELMIATLGILKAGAAYVPLDPAFPVDRVAFMIEDSAMPMVVTQSALKRDLPDVSTTVVEIDSYGSMPISVVDSPCSATASNLAYVIYTSGSTGKPKGVMLEHRNVVNFYTAMDAAVPGADMPDRTWLAVTSLSFDISVLELFWTLNRGFKVVIYDEGATRLVDSAAQERPRRILDMGLFMWGNDDAPGPAKYTLLMEGAKFFDQNGFSAVWTPERHFHAFGGPYPNPAVTGAAVAAVTENVKIRAGSCVVPLHHPVRIAEEWSVVDNLSNGRVEIAAASGWNPNDFVLRPENHAENKRVMYDQLEQVRQLWRGEKVSFPGPLGEVEVESLPRPVQPELPCWITTAGNPETWIEAGRKGMNVLTHLLGQSVDEVAGKIRLYRDARKEAGFDPDAGRVALMLHTFVGADNDSVREIVREPMKDYLSSSMSLAMDYAWSFPAFKRPGGDATKPEDVDLKSLSDDEVDTILNFAFERYFVDSGLFGDHETCLRVLARCAEAGVDEIACLMDFGVETTAVMESLPRLKTLRDDMIKLASQSKEDEKGHSFADLVQAHAVSHLQCTPSTARMYIADTDTRQAFGNIQHILLGGEALPTSLASEVKNLGQGTLTNMYGPTETTIWSLTSAVHGVEDGISIGKPVANTQVYVLDQHLKPLPVGVPGELHIAGDGVARGYLNRPELTEERFVADPFASAIGARMYATGDLAAFRADGTLDYLGRTDFQVKVRGYRIEPGEIEAELEDADAVAEAAVVVRTEDVGDERLVAYVTVTSGATFDVTELRTLLRRTLPDYMIPNEFVQLDLMPRTANGKLDRKALVQMQPTVVRTIDEGAAPKTDLEKVVAESWRTVLKLDAVGLEENFFDLGGHSLLVVQLHGLLKESIDRPISLTDLYQYTTIKSLAEYLTSGADDRSVKQSVSRGEQRRALRRRRVS